MNSARMLKLLGFTVLLCMAVMQLRFSVIEQELFTGTTDETGIRKSRDSKLLTNLAKEKHLFEADLNSAVTLLQHALLANPFYVPAWLALAVVENDRGEKQQSSAILDYAHHLTSGIKRWRWDNVLTAYQLGQSSLLPTELSYIIAEIPGKSRNAALQLSFSQWPDPAALVDAVGQENLSHLYNYAVRTKDTEKTVYFQREMDALDIDIEQKALLGAIDMLMRNSEAAEAAAIWRRDVNPDSLLFNGSFGTPFIQRAFGWRRSKNPSVAVTMEKTTIPSNFAPEDRALHIRFKGWENLNYYHISQVVPLDHGSYKLTGVAKTQKLSTDQRPYFEVYGYECNDIQFHYEKTDMFPVTSDWLPLELSFTVPQGCAAAVLRLRRNKSNHIDSKITGHLWLADLRITEAGLPPSTLE